MGKTRPTLKIVILALFIALDFVLSPILRVEGMVPMSSVINVLAAVLMGPLYATVMAITTGLLRMLLLGIPPLALTGAVFGALLAGLFYRLGCRPVYALVGEVLGTGLIGSLLSYPVMVWFTGTQNQLYWFVYTPRFLGASIGGGLMGLLVIAALRRVPVYQAVAHYFEPTERRTMHD